MNIISAAVGFTPSYSNYRMRFPVDARMPLIFRSAVRPMPLLERRPVRYFSSNDLTALQVIKTRANITAIEAIAKSLNISPDSIRSVENNSSGNVEIYFKPSFLLKNPNFQDETSRMLEQNDVENRRWISQYSIEIYPRGMNDFVTFVLRKNGYFR